ncbi:peptidase MA family metallohydrolase [Risungbinella massiliensis]|uniref:peptidase MA family metallohydrolase n=1 Tax=Risungbinella massiliensis TaxID=1329796 RepID=UPI0005CC8CCA|nr:hypothetical protein [Risungbinella massiliensis]
MFKLLCLMTLIFQMVQTDPVSYSNETAIQKLLDKQSAYLIQKDLSGYLRTIHSDDGAYYYEQLRWLQDVDQYIDPASFQQKVVSLKKQNNIQVAEIEQIYSIKKKRYTAKKEIRINQSQHGWSIEEHFPYFLEKESIKVYYMNPNHHEKATSSLKIAQLTAKQFQQKYNWRPKQTIVKLYDRPEVFRTSVKFTLPQWAAGWHEHKESIKLIGSYDPKFLQNAIAHEMTHQMVSDLTGDNASYWLQEGAAMTYETELSQTKQTMDLPRELRFKVTELGEKDLESLPDQEAWRYYLSSKVLFEFLLDQYGQSKMEKLLIELAKSPERDGDSRSKRVENHIVTLNAIKKVYGMSEKDLNEGYLLYHGQ